MKIILIDFERNLKSSPSDRVFFVPTTYLYFFCAKLVKPKKENEENNEKEAKKQKEEGKDWTKANAVEANNDEKVLDS